MPLKVIRNFIKLETSGGIVLFTLAVIALVIDNSSWHSLYEALITQPITLKINNSSFSTSLKLFVNDGLMTLFFLLVSLEIKRATFSGELNSGKKILLPGLAALGGMIVPAVIYIICNWSEATALRGWAIPCATDIAFSLGILSLLGSRIPISLKNFLTTLAILDDIGAILLIAFFYTEKINGYYLMAACCCTLLLVILNRLKIMKITPYLIGGFILWYCILGSGVHPTLAGVITAFVLPLQHPTEKRSPLRVLENALHPWVAFLILPIFAFVNSGIYFHDLVLSVNNFTLPLGIVLGLFIGKQLGIMGGCWLGTGLFYAKLPHQTNWYQMYAISIICGVGFTMSLFIGELAFAEYSPSYMTLVHLGVLVGSFLSGIVGYTILRLRQS